MHITAINNPAWPHIMRIQAGAYTALEPENEAVLRSKWQASPATCLQCVDGRGAVLGYLLSHPWSHAGLPALNRSYPINRHSETLYLHDLAVAPESHGQGVGRRLLQQLLTLARERQFRRITLISVQGSSAFWARFGFVPAPTAALCPGYGPGALAMTLKLA